MIRRHMINLRTAALVYAIAYQPSGAYTFTFGWSAAGTLVAYKIIKRNEGTMRRRGNPAVVSCDVDIDE